MEIVFLKYNEKSFVKELLLVFKLLLKVLRSGDFFNDHQLVITFDNAKIRISKLTR